MKRFLKKHLLGPWTNRVVALALVLLGLVGLIRIYANGAAALDTITSKELMNISLSYDLNALKAGVWDDNRGHGAYSLLNDVRLLDRDGAALPDDAAFYNLVGVRTLDHNTRYLNDRLVADPDRAAQYSPLTGVRRNDSPAKTASTTLDTALQEQIYAYLTENALNAIALVADANSGEVLAAVSCGSEESDLLNRTLRTFSPGSTQKLTSLLVIAAAGGDLTTPYECKGEFVAEDGQIVRDSGVHGTVDAAGAFANSCNCWFADRISKLDHETVNELYRSLGYLVNEETRLTSVDGVPRSMSSVKLNTVQWDYNSLWNVIGEDTALVNPFDLCGILSAVGDPDARQAHFLSGETTSAIIDNWPEELKAALPTVNGIMQAAYQNSYIQRGFPDSLLMGKTGTAEYNSTGDDTGRRFIGLTQSGKVFYLAVEDYKVDGVITTDLTLEQMVSDLAPLIG